MDNNKYISTRRLNVTKSQLNRTFLKVSQNIIFPFKVFTTQTTAKLFVVRGNFPPPVICLEETLEPRRAMSTTTGGPRLAD